MYRIGVVETDGLGSFNTYVYSRPKKHRTSTAEYYLPLWTLGKFVVSTSLQVIQLYEWGLPGHR